MFDSIAEENAWECVTNGCWGLEKCFGFQYILVLRCVIGDRDHLYMGDV